MQRMREIKVWQLMDRKRSRIGAERNITDRMPRELWATLEAARVHRKRFRPRRIDLCKAPAFDVWRRMQVAKGIPIPR